MGFENHCKAVAASYAAAWPGYPRPLFDWLPHLAEAAVEAAMLRCYHDVVGPCWPPERRLVMEGYRSLELHRGSCLLPNPKLPPFIMIRACRSRWARHRVVGIETGEQRVEPVPVVATGPAVGGGERDGDQQDPEKWGCGEMISLHPYREFILTRFQFPLPRTRATGQDPELRWWDARGDREAAADVLDGRRPASPDGGVGDRRRRPMRGRWRPQSGPAEAGPRGVEPVA